MLAYFLMNLYINRGFCFFRVKINFLIPLNSGYYMLKLVERNLYAYKLIVEENLLVLSSKVFTKREVLLLAI